ncbi:MAG: SDR family NAD(P)-dependent oxidoreductase [bacterium]
MRVKDKVALVTGAGAGIGKATALMLAREGAYVAVTDVDHDAACRVAEQIIQEGYKGFAWQLDVTDEHAWRMVLNDVVSITGKLDVLVNNAGIALYTTLPETTLEAWETIRSINLDGVFIGCKLALEHITDGGSIINVSSIAGLVAMPKDCGYNATKGGVKMLTKGLAFELAQAGRGIRVNSVHPGGVNTEMFQAIAESSAEAAANLQAFTERHPLGRLADPSEIAAGILFLASDESSFMTGSELVIDGGYTAV